MTHALHLLAHAPFTAQALAAAVYVSALAGSWLRGRRVARFR
jgi:hypothetical protein